MSWLCKLVCKNEHCHTADENLGMIRMVFPGTYSVLQHALETLQ